MEWVLETGEKASVFQEQGLWAFILIRGHLSLSWLGYTQPLLEARAWVPSSWVVGCAHSV